MQNQPNRAHAKRTHVNYGQAQENYAQANQAPANQAPANQAPANQAPANQTPKVDTEKRDNALKKMKEKQILNDFLRTYRNIRRLGGELYPREIHYSKLLIDEKKKKNRGILYIQKAETKNDLIDNIKEKYSINENLFISTDYNIDELEEEANKSIHSTPTAETVKPKVIAKPKVFLNATFETIVNSFKKSKIEEKYHNILAVTNLSYLDFNNFKELFHLEIKDKDEKKQCINMINSVQEVLIEKIPNIAKVDNLNKSLKKFLNSFIKTKDVSGDELKIIPDDLSLFILFHNLLIEKSFWMLIPKKNKNFLSFLVERILEKIDENNSEIIYYVTQKNAEASIQNFDAVITEITKEYFSDPEAVKHFIKINNLDKETPLIKNYELKITPSREYYDDHSFSRKWDSIPKKEDIFNLFQKSDKENLVILLISTGSKGVIQYLLLSALLIIFNEKKGKSTFKDYLVTKDSVGTSFIQNITAQFKKKIFISTKSFESHTTEPYQRFLEFTWGEYKTIHTKSKKEMKKVKKIKKEELMKYYEDIRYKKAVIEDSTSLLSNIKNMLTPSRKKA